MSACSTRGWVGKSGHQAAIVENSIRLRCGIVPSQVEKKVVSDPNSSTQSILLDRKKSTEEEGLQEAKVSFYQNKDVMTCSHIWNFAAPTISPLLVTLLSEHHDINLDHAFRFPQTFSYNCKTFISPYIPRSAQHEAAVPVTST